MRPIGFVIAQNTFEAESQVRINISGMASRSLQTPTHIELSRCADLSWDIPTTSTLSITWCVRCSKLYADQCRKEVDV